MNKMENLLTNKFECDFAQILLLDKHDQSFLSFEDDNKRPKLVKRSDVSAQSVAGYVL